MVVLRKNRSAVGPWVQLTATEGLSDPSSITDGATGLSNGIYTFQSKDSGIVQLDGYQENIPIFPVRLLDVLPSFDPATDLLDFMVQFLALPLNAAKYGIGAFVADGPVANRATWSAGGAHVYPNSTTVINGGIMGATAQGSGASCGSNLLPTTAFVGRMYWHTETAPTIRVTGQAQRAGGDEVAFTAVGATGAAFAGALGDWRLCIGLEHVSGVDATDNIIQLKAYVRQARIGGWFS